MDDDPLSLASPSSSSSPSLIHAHIRPFLPSSIVPPISPSSYVHLAGLSLTLAPLHCFRPLPLNQLPKGPTKTFLQTNSSHYPPDQPLLGLVRSLSFLSPQTQRSYEGLHSPRRRRPRRFRVGSGRCEFGKSPNVRGMWAHRPHQPRNQSRLYFCPESISQRWQACWADSPSQQGCVGQSVTVPGCTGLDVRCICSNTSFLSGISCCIESSCSPEDQARTSSLPGSPLKVCTFSRLTLSLFSCDRHPRVLDISLRHVSIWSTVPTWFVYFMGRSDLTRIHPAPVSLSRKASLAMAVRLARAAVAVPRRAAVAAAKKLLPSLPPKRPPAAALRLPRARPIRPPRRNCR